MDLFRQWRAGPDDTQARRMVKVVGGGGVLALALVALAGGTVLVRGSHDPDLHAVPVSIAPALAHPTTTPPAAAETPRAADPSESDLLLQAYAPHGG